MIELTDYLLANSKQRKKYLLRVRKDGKLWKARIAYMLEGTDRRTHKKTYKVEGKCEPLINTKEN